MSVSDALRTTYFALRAQGVTGPIVARIRTTHYDILKHELQVDGELTHFGEVRLQIINES